VAILTSKLAPLPRLVAPCVETVNDGLNGRLLQPDAANWLDTDAGVPCALVTVAEIVLDSQPVGLNVKFVPSPPTVTLTILTRNGTPSIICGNGSATTVTAGTTLGALHPGSHRGRVGRTGPAVPTQTAGAAITGTARSPGGCRAGATGPGGPAGTTVTALPAG